jgi:peptidoglycan/xylan/chitin deacetylase (PgdA/CDA1 family)
MIAPIGAPRLSVIIPARDAAGTIAETLESLRAQSVTDWHAIVVDDGSTDDTAAVAGRYAALDPRIAVACMPARGVSAARNEGLARTSAPFVHFLDADDLLAPRFYGRTLAALEADPTLALVYTDWERLAPDGTLQPGPVFEIDGDGFPILARVCAFVIHGCVSRRTAIVDTGGFDPALAACEDWDLWQRMARRGVRMRRLPESLVLYRMRERSASLDVGRMMRDGTTVVRRGHAPDPRVTDPLPAHANGADPDRLAEALYQYACWPAGLAVGAGADVRTLLDVIADQTYPALDPFSLAGTLVHAMPLPACRPAERVLEVLPSVRGALATFLDTLEARSGAPALARRALAALDHVLSRTSTAPRPRMLTARFEDEIDITHPLPEQLALPRAAERYAADVVLGHDVIGEIELPIFDGAVRAAVIGDNIAWCYGWEIMKRHLAARCGAELAVDVSGDQALVRRGAVVLADGLDAAVARDPVRRMDAIGWHLFLQELWGLPSAGLDAFYGGVLPGIHPQEVSGSTAHVEVASPLRDLCTDASELDITFSIGGALVGRCTVPVRAGRVAAAELVRRITTTAGAELVVVAVREGLLGTPLLEGAALRIRLQDAAASPRAPDLPNGGLQLGPWPGTGVGGTGARWASLPLAAEASMRLLAAATGASVLEQPAPGAGLRRHALYAPTGRPVPSAHPANGAASATEPVAADAAPANGWLKARWRSLEGAMGPLFRGARRPPSLVHPPGRGQSAPDNFPEALPILMYHRVASRGPASLARYRVSPDQLDEQLGWLRDAGYEGTSLREWDDARGQPAAAGGRILLTFDDASEDFATDAWPILARHGFGAVLFVVSGLVGGMADWDATHGRPAPLLDWSALRQLQRAGAVLGAHSMTHPHLTGLTPRLVVRETFESRARLMLETGAAAEAFAYPYGDMDRVVEHLVGAAGFTWALGTRPGRCGRDSNLLALPRIEVKGSDTLADFVRLVRG